jgi:hypothetical protein
MKIYYTLNGSPGRLTVDEVSDMDVDDLKDAIIAYEHLPVGSSQVSITNGDGTPLDEQKVEAEVQRATKENRLCIAVKSPGIHRILTQNRHLCLSFFEDLSSAVQYSWARAFECTI